jgi:pilus assembly protein Flp/PilA
VDWFNEMYLRVSTAVRSLRDREEGQGLVEYAVLIGIITVAVVGIVGLLSGDVFQAFDTVENAILGDDGDGTP